MDSLQAFLTEYTCLAKDALLSGTWFYPLQSIYYIIRYPSLYQVIAPILLRCFSVSAGITCAMFFFTYLPQVAFCAILGPFAFLTAATMVLGESYALILLVMRMFFLEDAQDKLFDAVLLQRGHEELVAQSRQVKSRGKSSGFRTMGKSLTKPLDRFSKEGLVRYIISLPLNSVPVVGTILFLLYNGMKSGPRYHTRYFQLKRMDKKDRDSFIDERRAAYTAFGSVSLALELVPVIGPLFSFTSNVGAALWASDLENSAARQQLGSEVQIEIE